MNALETLAAVLCDPEGKCCISGSDEDRRLIDSALAALAAAPAQHPWQYAPPAQERIDALELEAHQLSEQIIKLRAALAKANSQAEHFEREWYLRGDALEAALAGTAPAPSKEYAEQLENLCATIKTEDDYCVEHGDYMLDSDDCIKIVRGEWVRPDYLVDAARKQGVNHD